MSREGPSITLFFSCLHDHRPPLFSAGLAGLGFIGIDPVDGDGWINALIFEANITLLGLIDYS